MIEREAHTYQYEYDLAGRLVEVREDGTPIHLYDYDANGNRTSHTGPAGTRTGTYDAQDRITAYGDATYTQTPAGERASKTTPQGTTEYDFDAAGNLRGATLPDGTEIEYLIDGQDRRIGRIVDGTLQQGWLYRDQLNPVAQLDADGNVTHRFIYGDKPNVPAYMIKDGTAYRIISDHLGSVRLVIDTDTNEIVQRMDYSPFGEVTTDANPGFQPFGFAGGLYDRDTGLTRFGARDYDPQVGRWTAKDPIGFASGQINLFNYLTSDPINAVDLSGLGKVCTRALNGLNAQSGYLYHSQIWHNDGTNSGFFPDGIQSESPGARSRYQCGEVELDDSTLRQAEQNVAASGDFTRDTYNLATNNCQDYTSSVLQRYYQIKPNNNNNITTGGNRYGGSGRTGPGPN